MKILYSSWFGPSIGNDNVSVSRSSKKMSEISNFLSQKHGFETVFVGDDKAIELYKEIPFNHVLKFDDRINRVPKCMWSAGKLIALSMMDEPAIHVDYDVFFLNPPIQTKLEKEIICFHTEKIWNKKWKSLYDTYLDVAPTKTLEIQPISYNCGLVGGTDINLIKKCANELIEHITLNYDKINTIYSETKKISGLDFFHIPAVLLEQLWMFQLFTYYGQTISPYFDGEPCEPFKNPMCELNVKSLNEGIIHFQFNKNTSKSVFAIRKFHNILLNN